MKSKKGDGISIEFIIWLAIGLIATALILKFLVFDKITKAGQEVDTQLDKPGDFDGDKIINLVDKCPCVLGTIENDGCPNNYKITGKQEGKESTKCPKKT